MTLRNEIIENWNDGINGHLMKLKLIDEMYPAYTLKIDNKYGVAIPLDNEVEVNEDFSNAKLLSKEYRLEGEDESRHFLTLITEESTDKNVFSSLCEQFVFPGEHGEFRTEIVDSPIKWWMEMKQILGNRNIDEMIYDTLGELCIYDYLVRSGKRVTWNGPKGGSADLESDEMIAEVKSTLSRSKREITVHGKNQLKRIPNKQLYLYLCVFEMASTTGHSINDIVYGLANDGYDVSEINELLRKKGFEIGKSSRDRKFILWNVYKYTVDEKFPKITDDSFVDGKEPEGIVSISYTVDLGGVPYEIVVDGSV